MKTKLLSFLVSIFLISNLYGQFPFDSCLVAYYPFNGNANDESGHGYDGTVSGPILTNDRFGNSNAAYLFDGIDDYITTEDISLPNSFSVSVWAFNLSAYGNKSGIIDKWHDWRICGEDGTVDEPWLNGNEGIEFSMHDGTDRYGTGFETSSISTWYHIIGIYDDNLKQLSIYVNNNYFGTSSFTNRNFNNYEILIGTHYPLPVHNFFNGILDDIRVYNCALDSAAIQDLYNEPNSSIGELNNTQQIDLFPNPSKDFINIKSQGIEIKKIEIYNLLGSKLRLYNGNIDLINISDLKNGVYLIKIYDTKGIPIKFEKVIKN